MWQERDTLGHELPIGSPMATPDTDPRRQSRVHTKNATSLQWGRSPHAKPTASAMQFCKHLLHPWQQVCGGPAGIEPVGTGLRALKIKVCRTVPRPFVANTINDLQMKSDGNAAPQCHTPVLRSSAPVGSSQSSTAGRLAIARATATRCCSPPESCAGKCSIRSPRPTSRSASSALIGWSAISPTSSTFSCAVRLGIRL